jgi:iron complex outermembrane receptor protein
MRWLSAFFISVCIFYPAWLSGQEITDTINVREVRVTAQFKNEDAGVKVTRADSMAMVNTLTTDISELIAGHTPVFIRSYGRGSPAAASFRGTSSTHTQVLWNGMNLNSPMRGMADLSLLPVFFTDDVYLLHGSSSMINGSGALGGSINMVNNPDWSSGLKINSLIEKGSFNSGKAFLKMNLGTGRININTRIFNESSQNDFTFYNSGVIPHRKDTLDNADYSKTGLLQEIYLRASVNNIITLRFWHQNTRRNLPQLMSYEGSEQEEYLNDKQYRGQAEWKKYSEKINFQFFTGINSGNLDYYRATPEFNFINEDSESREISFFNFFKINKEIDKNLILSAVINTNYHMVEASDRIRDNGYQQDRLEGGVMLNMKLKPSDHLRGFILMRSEFYDSKFIYLIPAAGAEWQFGTSSPFMLLINAGRNYHKPALNDLYWLPGGNPDLLPEDGFSGDITLSGDFNLGKIKFKNEVTSYISKINNWIMWQPASNGAYYQEAGNVKNVFSRGLEYQLSGNFEMKGIVFSSGGNYAYTHTANVDAVNTADKSRGKQLVYIPKNKGNYFLSAGWKNITVRYDMTFTGKRYTKSSNQESDFEKVLNPYMLGKVTVDHRIDWNKFRLNTKLVVENIFNTTYQSILWRPMPGRFYSISIGIRYN